MEQWIDVHGSEFTDSEWTERLNQLETFREGVAQKRSRWLIDAIELVRLFERTKPHQDVERIRNEFSLDMSTTGSMERDIVRQWNHYLSNDYEPTPF